MMQYFAIGKVVIALILIVDIVIAHILIAHIHTHCCSMLSTLLRYALLLYC